MRIRSRLVAPPCALGRGVEAALHDGARRFDAFERTRERCCERIEGRRQDRLVVVAGAVGLFGLGVNARRLGEEVGVTALHQKRPQNDVAQRRAASRGQVVRPPLDVCKPDLVVLQRSVQRSQNDELVRCGVLGGTRWERPIARVERATSTPPRPGCHPPRGGRGFALPRALLPAGYVTPPF